MIVSNDSVNAIALPYVWQLTDNYGYTHYYLQTNTLSQTVAIHSQPDSDDLPWGHEANLSENEASVARGQRWGRGQILQGRGQKIWPRGHVGLNIPDQSKGQSHLEIGSITVTHMLTSSEY